MAFSATFPANVLKIAESIMKSPQRVQLVTETAVLVGMLLYGFLCLYNDEGVKQYFLQLPSVQHAYQVYESKVTRVVDVLSRVPFHQALVFTNQQDRHLCEIAGYLIL